MYFKFCLPVFVVLVKRSYSDDVFTNRFANIRFTPTFIDKTPLIYEVFKHKHLFINAPFHFGKSTNIGMLNMFLSNLRTKETIEEYFNGTEIWKDEAFVREHLGEYPVILYNTSVCGVVYDEDHMLTTFQWTLYNAFIDHAYLLQSRNISSEVLGLLKIYMNLKKIQCLKIKSVTKGLSFLAQLLYKHHGKRVILLGDGFGQGGIERILEDNNDLKYLSPLVVEWYSSIINNTLLNQDVICRAVVSAETWLYGLKGPAQSLFEKIGFMEKKEFSRSYGFTYDELEYLLSKFNIPMKQRPEVLKWYCGYSTVDGEVKVCNPISILHYLQSPYKIIRVYWTGSPTGPDLLQRMVEVKGYGKHLVDLVFNRPINVTLEKGKNTEGVGFLRRKVEELTPESESFICQVLLDVGYLTYAGRQQSGTVSLKFPNEEIRSVVDKFISFLSFI